MAIGDVGEFTSLALGVNAGVSTDRAKLFYQNQQWLSTDGSLTIDLNNTNDGTLNPTAGDTHSPGLVFGSSASEGIASKRTDDGNQYGLDFYTNSTIRLSITSGGNVRVGSSSAPGNLTVSGALTVGDPAAPTTLTVNGTATTTGALTIGTSATANLTVTGNVGIGTSTPQARLQVTNGAIMPSTGNTATAGIMFPRDPGGGSGDAGWLRYYPRSGEACTLELGISNDADDHIALMPSGNVGIGTTTPGSKLDVVDRMRVRQGAAGTAGIWFYQSTPAQDRAFVGMAGDNQVGLWGNTGANWGLVMDTSSGDVQINGNLTIPNTDGGTARFTKQKFSNESSFRKNNVKLSMGSVGPFFFPGTPPLEYEFSIGHTSWSFILNGSSTTNFSKRFSINQNGDAYFAGAKSGYVVDYFVNRVGDTLEQGDVIVLSNYAVTHYSGTQNDIPIPEVDLASDAYDSRVCGIVASFVTEQDLPYVEVEQDPNVQLPPEAMEEPKPEEIQPSIHPLRKLAGEMAQGIDRHKVQDQQLGKMVTLGAYAHCKVDADIASIAVGDLLTTSPTKGHAQKVLQPERAIGAIVGKALASLEKGKGKIPVLVMLQ